LENPQRSANVYILITKSEQIEHEAAELIHSGKRFEELVLETNNRMASLADNQKLGSEIDDFELEYARKRNEIWQFLRQMHIEGRVNAIKVQDKFSRKRY